MNKTSIISLIICVKVGMFIGTLIPRSNAQVGEAEVTDWTCSMHPQVSLPEKGLCPICEMDLIARASMQSSGSGDTLELSEHAHALAQVETVEVLEIEAIRSLDIAAKVTRDETKVKVVTILGSGRVERLFANYVGMPVKKGDHLAEIFSPEFSSAAAELITGHQVSNEDSSIVQAATRRLKLLGVSDAEIKEIARSGKVPNQYTIYSPMDGIISGSLGHEGEWFKAGQKLFEIINLDTVWLMMDIYESQLDSVYFGQKVEVRVDSFPNRTWQGVVSFIEPHVNERSRSVKVRVQLENSDEVLRPMMLARAKLAVRYNAESQVIRPIIEGKWISPMHPEIIRDEPGACPVCGMRLIKSEEYMRQQSAKSNNPLIVPVESPLIIGDKAVVYLEVKPNGYRPQLISLGQRVDAGYIVLEGLKSGDNIVSRGAFRLDSDLQIQGHMSMMNVWQQELQTAKEKAEVQAAIDPMMKKHVQPGLLKVAEQWVKIQEALSKGDLSTAIVDFKHLDHLVHGIPHLQDITILAQLDKELHAVNVLIEDAVNNRKSKILAPRLADFSETLLRAQEFIGFGSGKQWAVMHCPMVPRDGDKEGASWIQKPGELWNPFFFGGMKHCGEHKEDIDD